jgi:hypothetical protein
MVEWRMRQNAALAYLGGAAMLIAVAGWSGAATAQVNCETIPPGPARTDCYIGLSRIARQNSEIAASVAQQQTDRAIYRSVTGSSRKKKMYRTLR